MISWVAVVVVVLPDLVVLTVTHEASYLVIAEPPLDDGAVNVTVAVPEPAAVTEVSVGAPGAVLAATGVTVAADEASPVPALLVAVTLQE